MTQDTLENFYLDALYAIKKKKSKCNIFLQNWTHTSWLCRSYLLFPVFSDRLAIAFR